MNANTVKIGVVGFSKPEFDLKSGYKILDKLFSEFKDLYSDSLIEVVSGYTNMGVPKIAYELADKYNFITVGFSAQQALQVRSGVYPVAKVILIGERFGDESLDFIDYIDILIRIGGGPQSRREVQLFKSRKPNHVENGMLLEFEVDWYGK